MKRRRVAITSDCTVQGDLEVNSSHHQAVAHVGKGLRIAARSPEGIIEAIEAKDGEDVQEIRRCSEAVTNASHTLAQMLYQQAQAAQQAQQASAGGGAQAQPEPETKAGEKKDEDIVDADFKVVDDDDRNK